MGQKLSDTDNDITILRELEHTASVNWAMAQRAERDGNRTLAETLAAVASEADRAALLKRRGAAVRY